MPGPVRINGQQQYLWHVVDQDGDVIDILVQSRRDPRAGRLLFHDPIHSGLPVRTKPLGRQTQVRGCGEDR